MIKENKIIKKIGLSVILLIVFVTIFLVSFYFLNPLNKFNQNFFKIIPYPIALINNNKIISTKNLLSDMESLQKFYSSQDFSEIGMRVDFTTIEGQQRLKIKEKEIFNKLIEDAVIKIIAESKGIEISKKEAGAELVAKAQEAGSTENLALNIKKLYNWSLSDFRDRIIVPRIYLNKLIEYYEKDEVQKELLRPKIEEAYKELKNGASFEEIAMKYSEGETAQNGGSLGWFKQEHLSKKIAEKAYSMQPGEFSEIIKSSLGSHLIFLEETQEKDGEKEVKIKQIFTQEGSFLNWLNDEKKDISIKIFLKDYIWNKDAHRVIFSDKNLEINEENLRNKSNGDPSVY